MGRRATDEITQEELILALKGEIDSFPKGLSWRLHRGRLERIADLIRRNPRSSRTRHVLHNLGSYRLEWLSFFAGEPEFSDVRSIIGDMEPAGKAGIR